MKKGLLIIMSGPSGVGKGTLREKIMEDKSLNLFYSVSMTTRAMRKGEKDGREYYFVSRDEFSKQVKAGNLLEWAEFVGNCYGTPKDKVEKMRNEGKNVLLEIDVKGTESVLSKVKDAISIFILPPSLEELENRIRGRSTETEDAIKNRLKTAKKELKLVKQYKYSVVNEDLDRAASEISKIIKKESL